MTDRPTRDQLSILFPNRWRSEPMAKSPRHLWTRIALPFQLNHYVNIFILDDGDGWRCWTPASITRRRAPPNISRPWLAGGA